MKTKTGGRKGTPPTASLTNSKNTGENPRKSLCTTTFVANGNKSTHASQTREIPRDEYEHLDKMYRCICDAAVEEGAFVIVDPKGGICHGRQ